METRPVRILLIEDNHDHAFLMKQTLESTGVPQTFHRVGDGAAAIDFLFHRNQYLDKTAFPQPDLILLDIKLPKINGLEVLKRIKQDVNLKAIPVIIVSSSSSDEDLKAAYEDGVNSYVTKPVNFSEFVEKINGIIKYWFKINILFSILV